MREIKFRVWFPKAEKMIVLDKLWMDDEYSSLAFGSSDARYDGICRLPTSRLNTALEPVKVDRDFMVMQFTGIKDKDGKDIYEGDIIINHWYNYDNEFIGNLWVVKFGEHMTSGDYYASLAYGWFGGEINAKDLSDAECCLNTLPGDIEVIGNIYEHPHLLKDIND